MTAVDARRNRSAASNEATATPNVADGKGLQLNGSSQYVTFGAGAGAEGARTSRSSCGSCAPAPASARHRRRRHRQRDPADHEGPRGDRDAGEPEHELLPRHRRRHGRLVADFEDSASGANHPVTGTTAVTSNVWHHAAAVYDTAPTPGACTSTACSTARCRSAATSPRVDEHPARRHRHRDQQHRRGCRLLPGRRRRGAHLEHARTGAQIQAGMTPDQLRHRPTRPLGLRGERRHDRSTASPGPTAPPSAARRGCRARRTRRRNDPPPPHPQASPATAGGGAGRDLLEHQHRGRPRRLRRVPLGDAAGRHDGHADQRTFAGGPPTTSTSPWRTASCTLRRVGRGRRRAPLAGLRARSHDGQEAAAHALEFNGSTQYVTFGAAPALNSHHLHDRALVPAQRRRRGHQHRLAAASPTPSR